MPRKKDILPAEICTELHNIALSAWRGISMEPDVQLQATALAQCESSTVTAGIPHMIAGGQLKWL